MRSFCMLEETQKCQSYVIARDDGQAIFKFPEPVPLHDVSKTKRGFGQEASPSQIQRIKPYAPPFARLVWPPKTLIMEIWLCLRTFRKYPRHSIRIYPKRFANILLVVVFHLSLVRFQGFKLRRSGFRVVSQAGHVLWL
eukprot:6192697-Pleurochrysis_carterae.AAC.1